MECPISSKIYPKTALSTDDLDFLLESGALLPALRSTKTNPSLIGLGRITKFHFGPNIYKVVTFLQNPYTKIVVK